MVGTLNFPAQGGTAGGCGVPAGATSAIINFVTVLPAGAGNIRAWAVTPSPAAQLPAPTAAVINYGTVVGLPAIANGVEVPLCNPAAGTCTVGDLRLQADTSSTDILGDGVGYFRNPQGATPGTIVTTVSWNGLVNAITASSAVYVFAGPTVSVTVAAGQRLTGAAVAPLGATLPGDAYVGLCYQVGAGTINNFVGLGYSVHRIATTRQSFSAAASTAPGAGTYNVGMCVKNYWHRDHQQQ